MSLTFIHLSDIHLNRWHAKEWDLDEYVRDELESDLRDITSKSGRANGLLVTGDIAYSGKPAEYEIVGDWLAAVAESVCEPGFSILTVPGNHDVDRSVVERSQTVELIHEQIRRVDDARLDQTLEAILSDRATGPELLSSLEAYNNFAARFGCQITPGSVAK
ncbi:MAG TPA: metallophosphoesterase [Kribbellaceae bacterium]|nr:metallophosphoesterase [Kribbellaceae bacterium]